MMSSDTPRFSIWWLAWMAVACLVLSVPAVSHAQSGNWRVQGDDDRRREIVRRYKKLLEKNPVEGVIFKKLVQYVGEGEGLDRLIASYRKRVEQQPDRANLRLVLGHLLKKKNADEKALTHYDKAAELWPDKPVVWMSRGSLYAEMGERQKAVADYEKALEGVSKRSRKKKLLRKLADLAFQQHDWERAQGYYDQLIELDPRNEYLRMEYAQVLIEHERYEKALEQYQTLLELAGRNPKTRAKTLRDMGDLYETMGRGEKAIETYRRAMNLMRSGHWLHESLRKRVVEAYRAQDRLGELLALYERQWPSPNYERSMTLGRLSDELGETEKALDYYRRASQLRGSATEPRQHMISIHRRRGDARKVVDLHEELIRIEPRNAQFRFELVQFHFQRGAREKALEQLETIRRRFRGQPSAYRKLADTYMRYDMGREAREIYETLVEMEPSNPSYLTNLGESYYRAGQLEKAVETWTRLLDSSLDQADAYARLGRIFSEHGMIERGIRNYRKAVETEPDELAHRRGLASTYEQARRWEKAIEVWHEVLDATDQAHVRSEARGRIVSIFKSQNQLQTKLESFERQFESDPPDLEAGYFLAESHMKLNQYEKAKSVYRRIVESDDQVDTSDVDALRALQKLHRQTGDLEEAIEVLQRLAGLQPRKQRDYYHRIAELSLKLYADEQAVKYAALAVEKNPDDPDAHARLGNIYRKMQRLEAAVEEYERAVDLDPKAHRHALTLADLLVELDRKQEAEQYYLQVTKRAEESSLILKAARRAIDLAMEDGRLRELERELSPLVYQSSDKRIYRKVMLEVYEQMVTPLIVQTTYGVGAGREELRARIASIGDRASPVLTSALEAKDIGQRALAVRLLGGMREPSAALKLARMAIDPEEPLRTLAAISVAQIGDSRAVEPLVQGLESDDPEIREASAWALGYVGGDAAREALARQLEEGQNGRQQALAAIGIGRIGGEKAAERLTQAYGRLKGSSTRDGALSAVVWGMGRAENNALVSSLERALLSGREGVLDIAGASLARTATSDALRALLEGLWSGRPTVREASARGLSRLATRLEARERREGASRERLRSSLVEDLAAIDDRRHRIDVRKLVQRLRRESTYVGTTRSETLFVSYGDSLSKGIGRALQSDTPSSVREVLGDLARADGPSLGPLEPNGDEARQALLEALRPHTDTLARLARLDDSERAAPAMELLGWLDPSRIEELVRTRLASGPPEVRAAAARTLGRLPVDDARLDALLTRRDASHYVVRKAVCQGLGHMVGDDPGGRSGEVVDALETRLVEDDFPSVRIASARALGRIGTESAVSVLASRLETLPTMVKMPALRALSTLDAPTAEDALEPYRDSNDIRIQRAVEGS
jgi:tetratricopeptide (TPR) repeat protein/HEAT repeat protein